ncbi:unnamed protein product [Lactuca saligna]|uniref:SWIM-type domain-containing protein n=1 Tax=Lactuca saligna TaxID=75948 RepID=A0AA35Z4F1_LACSI|nr:unnamed protein product [Lactuca saligna]
MASSSTGMYVSVDFHYNGFFSPNPLVYLDPVKTNVRDVDFGGFTYKEFLLWLTKLTNGECDNVYYCMRKESLCEGIRRIDSDADYWEFVETVYSLESDSLENGKGYELDELDEEDDKDSEVSMKMEYEHEWDDEDEHTFDKTVRDPFLDKLSGHISDDDEEEANNGKLKDVVFPVHNENQEWEQMVPVLGMKFSNPLELKLCITNYAVKNGYDLWYEKSDHERLLGLLEAVKERVPAAEHRQCARHICANFLKRQKIKGQSWDLTICPTIRLKLSKLKDLQRFWKVIPSGYQQYEVRLGYDAYVVDIGSRTCACRTWQLTGYPCVHGYACIASLNRDVQEYVSPWFTTSMYLNCYRNTINPLNGSDMWPHVDYISPLPPKRRRLPGRPSTKRKRDQIERENQGKKHSITKRGSVMKCSICRESGHNRTTCPQKPIGESSNASSKKKKSKKADKVKVVLAHEVDIDSDSEVEIEPESDVDSFDLEFEDDVQPEVEDGVEPEVQDGVQHEVQDEVQAEVEPENHPEVHDANQVEVHLAVQAEVEPEVQVQVEDANQIVVQDQVEIPAFQVVVGKRARKPSERITKLKIRKMWEGKQGSSDDNPYELD